MSGKASKAFYRGVKSGQEEYAEKVRALKADLAAAQADVREWFRRCDLEIPNWFWFQREAPARRDRR